MATDVAGNLKRVVQSLPPHVRLVAVSKFHPNEELMAAYEQGQRIFGESQEQELSRKTAELPKDIPWHFVGQLQTNQVKYIAPYIDMIEAVDSLRLLREINKQAEKCGRVIDVLLELHVAQEATKYGFTPDACRELLASGEWRELSHIRICGLTTMASNVDDEGQIRAEMTTAWRFFDEIKSQYFAHDDAFKERSWGMSHDYPIALQCGSTMVRVGTNIFGERQY